MSDWSLLDTQWVQVSETDASALDAGPTARASETRTTSGAMRMRQRYERPSSLSVSHRSQPGRPGLHSSSDHPAGPVAPGPAHGLAAGEVVGDAHLRPLGLDALE